MEAWVNGAALAAGFRRYQRAKPRKSLVPDLVVMLMMPPPLLPYCASKPFVWTLNSWTVSGEKETASRASPTPVLLMPSASRFMLPPRPPFACKIKTGERRAGAQLGVGRTDVARNVAHGDGQIEHAASRQWRIVQHARGDGLAQRSGLRIDNF